MKGTQKSNEPFPCSDESYLKRKLHCPVRIGWICLLTLPLTHLTTMPVLKMFKGFLSFYGYGKEDEDMERINQYACAT